MGILISASIKASVFLAARVRSHRIAGNMEAFRGICDHSDFLSIVLFNIKDKPLFCLGSAIGPPVSLGNGDAIAVFLFQGIGRIILVGSLITRHDDFYNTSL